MGSFLLIVYVFTAGSNGTARMYTLDMPSMAACERARTAVQVSAPGLGTRAVCIERTP